jgi:hypothetical protein
MWTSEQSSAGMLTSSSARSMVASSSVNGIPECGFRSVVSAVLVMASFLADAAL